MVVATLVGFAVVGLLGAGVRSDFGPQLRVDAAVSEALYAGDDRARALDWLLEALTAPGLSVVRLVVLLPVVVWLAGRRAWRTVVWVVLSAGLIGPVTTALKDFFGRVRPAFEGGGARYESLSFPSGHSSGIAALVTVAVVLAWPWLTVAARRAWVGVGAALVVLVGLTRLWLGVHYLSDVLGGWALGLSWCLLVALLLDALPGGRAALPPR
ncbi:PAP2 family protein [Blastococcus sp. TF02-8]|nr:PAP2 family protein [Blastococcus sp. TF02-8]